MRRFLLIVVLCFLAVVSTGCKKAQLRRQLKELMGSTIVLPERITCVYNGEVYPMPDSLREKAKLIIYIDSSECTTCRISHLEIYRSAWEYGRRSKLYELLIVFEPVQFDSIPLLRYLSDIDFSFPLYLDDESEFFAINTTISSDARFHGFLTDKSNVIRLVGDPARNPSFFELIRNTTFFK